MKQAEIVEKLKGAAASVEKIDAEKLRGVAVIALPTGEFIETIVAGSEIDSRQFLEHVVGMITAAKIKLQSEQSGSGYPHRR